MLIFFLFFCLVCPRHDDNGARADIYNNKKRVDHGPMRIKLSKSPYKDRRGPIVLSRTRMLFRRLRYRMNHTLVTFVFLRHVSARFLFCFWHFGVIIIIIIIIDSKRNSAVIFERDPDAG